MWIITLLKKIAERNAPLARALEISVISSLISGVISLLQAVNAYFIQGSGIDYKLIIGLFLVSLVTGITAGLTKWLRDKQKEIDPSFQEITSLDTKDLSSQ